MKKKSKRWSFGKILLRTLAVILAAIAALVGYLCVYGFPEWLLADLLRKVDTGSFAIETGRLKLDLTGGLTFTDTSLYRKGIIGPPALEAERINVVVDPFSVMSGMSSVRSVEVNHGIFCSEMLREDTKARPPMDLDLKCVLKLEDCIFDGVPLESCRADVSGQGSTLRIDSMAGIVAAESRSGPFRGNITYDDISGVLEGHIETLFNPRIILPFVERRRMDFLALLINRFEFNGMRPRCEMDFYRVVQQDPQLSVKGKFWLSDCKYRGVDILRADGGVDVYLAPTGSTVRVDPLLVIRQEGNAQAWFAIDFDSFDISFHGVSSVYPPAVLKMAGIYFPEIMENWRFEGPVRVDARGKVNYRDKSRRKCTATVAGRHMGVGECMARKASFDLDIDGRKVKFSGVEGNLFDGAFKGNIELVMPDDKVINVAYKTDFEIVDTDATEVITFLVKKNVPDIAGKMSCRFQLEGLWTDRPLLGMKGAGTVSIKDGKVFSLPIFGGLSEMVTKIFPGLDFVLSQSDLRAKVDIGGGNMHMDEIFVEGDVLSLSGKGDYHAVKGLDYDVQLRLLKAHTVGGKLMRVITYPLSKLFEFKLKGALHQPKWYPVNFSPDLLEKMGFRDKTEDSLPRAKPKGGQ